MIELRRYRVDRGLSQAALAKELDCTSQLIYLYEAERIKRPRLGFGKRLSEFFGVSVEVLFSPLNDDSSGTSAGAA